MTRPTQHHRLLATAALGAMLLAAVPSTAKDQTTAEAATQPAHKAEIGDFGFDMKGMDTSEGRSEQHDRPRLCLLSR